MAIDDLEIDRDIRCLLANLEGDSPQEATEEAYPLDTQTVEIDRGYIPSAIRDMIKRGESKEKIRAILERTRGRTIALMAGGDYIPDVHNELAGRD